MFSFARFRAMLTKEFVQMRRDQVTLGMLVMIPLIQLVLFGYAINTNPRHLPTVIISADHSPLTRSLLTAINNTKYFHIIDNDSNEQRADQLLAEGKILFAINVPPNFSQALIRGEKPEILVTVDATDPVATGNAVSALNKLVGRALQTELSRGLPHLSASKPNYDIRVHARYNPESISQYNIVPGLMGVVLTMTMVMITALAVTRERERGTMESLLATPVRPLEVMLGKITPYIIVGYVQQCLIIGAAMYLFNVPNEGSTILLLLCTLPFIFANLALGLMFSTLATNQLQAMQMSFFFFLPSILLSGFMFPFYGMPDWAQFIGSALPLTHFLRITRGIMLKGNTWPDVWPNLWPILVFLSLAIVLGVKRYRQTLD